MNAAGSAEQSPKLGHHVVLFIARSVDRSVGTVQVERVWDETHELRFEHTTAMNQSREDARGERATAKSKEKDSIAVAERLHQMGIQISDVVEQAETRRVASHLGSPARYRRQGRLGRHRPNPRMVVDGLLVRSVSLRDRKEPHNIGRRDIELVSCAIAAKNNIHGVFHPT
jgi:hypothetical protein